MLNKKIKKESGRASILGDTDSFQNRQPIALLNPKLDNGKSVLKVSLENILQRKKYVLKNKILKNGLRALTVMPNCFKKKNSISCLESLLCCRPQSAICLYLQKVCWFSQHPLNISTIVLLCLTIRLLCYFLNFSVDLFNTSPCLSFQQTVLYRIVFLPVTIHFRLRLDIWIGIEPNETNFKKQAKQTN